MYIVQSKHPTSVGDAVWFTDKETDDIDEARSVKQDLDLYYKQVQIIEKTTTENVIE